MTERSKRIIVACLSISIILAAAFAMYFFQDNVEVKQTQKAAKIFYLNDLEQASYRTASPNLRYHGVITRKVTIKTSTKTFRKTVKFKWYSSRVLYHYQTSTLYVDKYGFYRGKKDRLLRCACSPKLAKKGSIIYTPWGRAKVFDTGCAYGTIDMYVRW